MVGPLLPCYPWAPAHALHAPHAPHAQALVDRLSKAVRAARLAAERTALAAAEKGPTRCGRGDAPGQHMGDFRVMQYVT